MFVEVVGLATVAMLGLCSHITDEQQRGMVRGDEEAIT